MRAVDKRGPGRPKDVELTSRRKGQILSMATKLFAQHGYGNTDVQQIADRLKVAKGTIYHYFGSKEALFLSAVDRGMERLGKRIRDSVADVEQPVEKISTAIRSFLAFFDDNPEMVELIVQERAEFRDRKKPTYLEHREKNVNPWNDLFQELSTRGIFRELEAEEVTLTINNLLYGTIFTTYFGRKGQSFESRADQILPLLFLGLLRREADIQLIEILKGSQRCDGTIMSSLVQQGNPGTRA